MKQDFTVIDLNKVFKALLAHIVPIALITVLCASLSFIYFSLFVDKEYSATVSIIVSNKSTMDEENTGDKVQSSDITASRMMTDTYIEILKNQSILEAIADRVNSINEDILDGNRKELNGTQIGKMLTMSAAGDTEILQIKAKTTDPQLSVDICYCVFDEAKVALQRILNARTVNSIEGDNILLPTVPVSPTVGKNTVIAALLGFVVGCGIFAVISILDRTVKATDDVASICGYPIIGEIPSIKTEAPKKPVKRKGWRF